MAINATRGTPFVGFVSLTNGAPGPTAVTLIVPRRQAATYVLASDERVVITNVTLSSNDTANPLVSITDNAASNPLTIFKAYTATNIPTTISIPPGVLYGDFGRTPVASTPAVTSAKTVEIWLHGVIAKGA